MAVADRCRWPLPIVAGAEAAPLAAGAASSDAELQWELQVADVAEEQENAEMQWLQTLTDS